MVLSALQIREKQNKKLKADLEMAIDYHYKKVLTLVKFYKTNKKLQYIVGFFIPGYFKCDVKKVTKGVIKLLKKENYGVKKLNDISFEVSWRLSNKDELKKYIRQLIESVYNLIDDAVKLNQSEIVYFIPKNFRFDREKVKNNLIKILEKKKFRVKDFRESLVIGW